jgi:hypothetical protein
MRLHRLLATATAASMLWVLSGCGGEGNRDAAKPSTAAPAKPAADGKAPGQASPANVKDAPPAKTDVGPKAPATGGKAAISAAFVRPEHCAAIVVHPRRMAEVPLVAGLLKDELVAGKVGAVGIEPKDIEQIVILVSLDKSEPRPPLAVVHFARDVDGMEILTKFRNAAAPPSALKNPMKEIQVAGKTCIELDKSPDGPLACVIDKRTILLEFHKQSMEKDLSGDAPAGPLVERLKAADADNDLIVCLAAKGFPAVDNMLDQMAKDPQATPYVDVAKGLQGATLALNLQGDSLLKIVAEGKDADAAGKIEKLLNDGLKIAAAGLIMARQSVPAEMKEAVAPGIKLCEEALDGTKVSAAGAQVTAVMKRPADLDKVIGPLFESYRKAAQGQAGKAIQMNNLKQVGLACLNYESTFGKFLTNIVKDGKPLLSWRVAILPYLEEGNLHKRFHLDEPWDSPHNLEAAKNMPDIYQKLRYRYDGKTCVMVFSGKGSPFDGDKPFTVSSIRDGMSNTILAVEAGDDKAVPWTKPEDLAFDPEDPAKALGDVPPAGFIALFFDGHVQTISKKVDAKTLKALITPSGAEPVQLP